MAYNIIEIMQKYSQFMQLLQKSGRNPEMLLEEELKKRNIDANQLQEMINQAKKIGSFLNIK